METLIAIALVLISVIVAIKMIRSTPYNKGFESYINGEAKHYNPYKQVGIESTKHDQWLDGYFAAKDDHEYLKGEGNED